MKQAKISDFYIYWKPLVEEYMNSELSMREFAKIKNISFAQLGYWKLKIEKMSSNVTKEERVSNFIPIIQASEDFEKHNLPDPIWLATLIREIYAIHK